MDRRSVVSLAAVVAGGLSVAGCMAPPRNDGQMFQRWAQAVAEIPTTDEEAVARDQARDQARGAGRAQTTLARAEPAAEPVAITLTADQAGLRPAMTINVVDPLELPDARDIGLRAVSGVMDRAMGGERPATLQRVSMTSEAPAASGQTWVAQLAAFRSRADAEAAWRQLKTANAAVLGRVSPRYQSVDLGAKGTWVRLRTSPLPSQAAAAAVCRAAGVTDRWCAKASG